MKKFKMFLISLSLATCFGSTFATQKNIIEKTDTNIEEFKDSKDKEKFKEIKIAEIVEKIDFDGTIKDALIEKGFLQDGKENLIVFNNFLHSREKSIIEIPFEYFKNNYKEQLKKELKKRYGEELYYKCVVEYDGENISNRLSVMQKKIFKNLEINLPQNIVFYEDGRPFLSSLICITLDDETGKFRSFEKKYDFNSSDDAEEDNFSFKETDAFLKLLKDHEEKGIEIPKYNELEVQEKIRKKKEELRKKREERMKKEKELRKEKEEQRIKKEEKLRKQMEEMKKKIIEEDEKERKMNTIDLTEFNEFLIEIKEERKKRLKEEEKLRKEKEEKILKEEKDEILRKEKEEKLKEEEKLRKEKEKIAAPETITITKPKLSKKSDAILSKLYTLIIKQARKRGLIKEYSNEEKLTLEKLKKQLLAYIYNLNEVKSYFILPFSAKDHKYKKYVHIFNLYLNPNKKNKTIELIGDPNPVNISVLELEEEEEEEDINTFTIPKNKIDNIEKSSVFEENLNQFFEDMKPNYSYKTENLFTKKQNERFNLFFKNLTDNDLEIKLIKNEIVNVLKNEDFSNEEKVMPLYMQGLELEENLFEYDGKYIMLGITKENEKFKVRIFTIYKK